MQLSCLPICYFPALIENKTITLLQWAEQAAGLGLDGIEVYEKFLDVQDFRSWQSQADAISALGLQVSMFTTYCDFASPDPGYRHEQSKHLHQAIEWACMFGAPCVRVTAGSWPSGLDREAALRNVADGLGSCVGIAATHGIWLALEDHPQIGTAIADFTGILELVGDERLKVNLDTSNAMEAGDDPVELARLVAPRVVHVHASDRASDLHHVEIGTGAVDFPAIFRELRAAGFDGWISLEAVGEASPEMIARSMAFIRQAWGAAA